MSRPKNSAKTVPVIPPTEFSPVISLSLKQAAAVTGITLWCLRSAIWDGDLRAHIAGKKQIVLRSDLERWIAAQPVVHRRTGRGRAA